LAQISTFPTHVGMNRGGGNWLTVETHVPHTRGDEPIRIAVVVISTKRSPHTWG